MAGIGLDGVQAIIEIPTLQGLRDLGRPVGRCRSMPMTSAAWKGSTIDSRAEAMHVFSPLELAEIDAALRHLDALGELDLPAITSKTFPLPTVGRYLADATCCGSG
jgi:hypothetical protein